MEKIWTNNSNQATNAVIFTAKIILILIIVLTLIGVLTLNAQSQYDVTVNSTFSPSIGDAQQKINQQAKITDTVRIHKTITHDVTPLAYQAKFNPEPINAPKVGKDKIARLYRNFLKVGFGNYWTPYLDFEVGSLRSTRHAYGVRVFHHSSWGKIKGYASPSSFSNTKAEIFGQKFFKNYTLNGKTGYNHLMAHAYGYQIDSIPEFMNNNIGNRAYQKEFHIFDAHIDLVSNRQAKENKLNQYYSLGYHFVLPKMFLQTMTGHHWVTQEHELDFRTNLNHDINFKRAGYLNVGGDAGLVYFNHPIHAIAIPPERSSFVDHNVIFNVKPQVSYTYGEYYVKAGLNVVIHHHASLVNQQGTRPHVYPDIEAKLTVVPKILTIIAGLDGALKDNSLRTWAREQPYLSYLYDPLQFTNEKLRLYAGLQTGIANGLTMGTKLSFAWVSNMSFFFPDRALGFIDSTMTKRFYLDNTFVNITANVKHLNLHFNLRYTYKEELTLNLNMDYNHYVHRADLLRPWYKPAFVMQFDGQYLLLKKFLFSLDFYINAGSAYPEFVTNGVKPMTLKPVFDFDFGFEYLWNQRFSIFANVNNFVCQRNFYYHDYPGQRINFLVGVKYCFGGERTGKK